MQIPIFPLNGAVLYPETNLPLNIFEDRYIQLVSDCMKEDRMFGMVQPKSKKGISPEVYKVGCLGKIISFNESTDKRFIISLSGLIRFKIKKELAKEKLYRKFHVDYSEFFNDLIEDKKTNSIDKENLLKKIIFYLEKLNYPIDHNQLIKLNLEQLINNICMIAPFSIEEKQRLIETVKVEDKIKTFDKIVTLNLFELQENKTVQ